MNDEQIETKIPILPDTSALAPFRDLCKVFDRIASREKSTQKKEFLASYFMNWRSSGGDIFPALRLIIPELDKERTTYGLRESTLAKTYIEVIGIAKDSADAMSLMNFKSSVAGGIHNWVHQRHAGNFPQVLKNVIQARINPPAKGISIYELNQQLDILNSSDKKYEIKL
ncbi:DNA ligase (ATP) [Nowakowskiella sp. JEL0078]|nr:DNA ligase (ATP) [Nowakowskiella sp. JEL0078]